ncbi:YciI family protein [Ponticaulis profundi]|uniref:YciI family protein n=1 Tax=Ponticaulis profundi TaxID=2665222 RepID=A0ABW1S916_9PROT
MALFNIIGLDAPGSVEKRMEHRPAHLEWAKAQKDIVRIAGPLFAEDRETPAGSLFVVEGESVAAVREWAAGDPYAKAGVFASVEIRPFKWVIGNPDA